jgi:hypothetical protein
VSAGLEIAIGGPNRNSVQPMLSRVYNALVSTPAPKLNRKQRRALKKKMAAQTPLMTPTTSTSAVTIESKPNIASITEPTAKETVQEQLIQAKDIIQLTNDIINAPIESLNKQLKGQLENSDLQYQIVRAYSSEEEVYASLMVKCAYKTIDKNILPYMVSQLTLICKEKKIPDTQLHDWLKSGKLIRKALAELTNSTTFKNEQEILAANDYNAYKSGIVTVCPWWNIFRFQYFFYTRRLNEEGNFPEDASFKQRPASYNAVPTFLKTLGWAAVGVGAYYGITRLYSRLTTTSIIPQAISHRLLDTATGTVQEYSANTNQNLSDLCISIFANSCVILKHSLEKNMSKLSRTLERESITLTTQKISNVVEKSDITSLLLPKLKRLALTSIKHLVSYKLVTSLSILTVGDTLRRWNSTSQNQASIDTDSAKEITTESLQEFNVVRKGILTILKWITPNSMRMSRWRCLSYAIHTIGLVSLMYWIFTLF